MAELKSIQGINKEIYFATLEGDLERVKFLNRKSKTPINQYLSAYAADSDKLNELKILLDIGNDPFLKNKEGETALAIAIKSKNRAAEKCLVEFLEEDLIKALCENDVETLKYYTEECRSDVEYLIENYDRCPLEIDKEKSSQNGNIHLKFGRLVIDSPESLKKTLADEPITNPNLIEKLKISLPDTLTKENLYSQNHDKQIHEHFGAIMAKFNNLKELDISLCFIKDLSPLKTKESLTHLDIRGNAFLSDINPLANLKNLEYLDILLCSSLKDLSPLYKLDKLKKIRSLRCPIELRDKYKDMGKDLTIITDDDDYIRSKEEEKFMRVARNHKRMTKNVETPSTTLESLWIETTDLPTYSTLSTYARTLNPNYLVNVQPKSKSLVSNVITPDSMSLVIIASNSIYIVTRSIIIICPV